MSSQRQRKKHSQIKKKRYDAKERGDKSPPEVHSVKLKETTKEPKSKNQEPTRNQGATPQLVPPIKTHASEETTLTTTDERRGGRALYSRRTIESNWEKYREEEDSNDVSYMIDEKALEQRLDQLLSLHPPTEELPTISASFLPDTSVLFDTDTTEDIPGMPPLTLNLENVASLLSSLPLQQCLMLDETLFNLCYNEASNYGDGNYGDNRPSNTTATVGVPTSSSTTISPLTSLTFKSVEHPSALVAAKIRDKSPETEASKHLDSELDALLGTRLSGTSCQTGATSKTSLAPELTSGTEEPLPKEDLDSMLDDLLEM